jgi:hypothetical protein
MVDPEGNTYERTAIESWLSTNQTSPITRSFLAPSMLNPNRALRDAIQQFRQMRGDTDMAEPPRAPSGQLAAPPPEPEIPEEPITLSAKPVSLPGGSAGVEISVEPPDGTTTRPMDIVAVVDVSGSMDAAALVDQEGQQVDVGFSVLDITKHALKTVIEALKVGPRVKFSVKN